MANSLEEKQYRYFILTAISLAVLVVVAAGFLFSSGDITIFGQVWKTLKNLWWLILPIPMWKIFMMAWEEYSVLMFILQRGKKVLLEIKPPADIEKSPKIMEQVFAGLHTHSTSNKFEVYCAWRPLQDKFSLEIVSIEGRVHFYIQCLENTRDNVEAQIYAQYPDAEIMEVEDYVYKVPKVLPNKEWDVWGTVLKLLKEDALPIRTWRYFREDVTGKMVDPLASMTEVMSTLKPGQYIWLQIIISPVSDLEWHPDSKKKIEEVAGKARPASSKNLAERFFDNLRDIFKNIFKGIAGKELEFSSNGEEEAIEFNINKLTPGEQEQIRAMEENISKPGFKTTIRFIYLGRRDGYNKALGVAGIMGAFKQLADVNLNALVPDNRTKTFANYYFTQPRMLYRQRKIIQNYRNRDMAGTGFIFNTEELATIFHFPDMSVKAPTIQKIEAKKGEAPANLPIFEESEEGVF